MSNFKTPFEHGKLHHDTGIPRKANPYYHAAMSNGARKPESRPSVQQWFAGWDEAAKAGHPKGVVHLLDNAGEQA